MLLSGKRVGRSSLKAATTAIGSKALFHVWDSLSKRKFLVDTGAEISVVPATRFDWLNGHSGASLLAANGSHISTFGTRTLTIQIPEGVFRWAFVVASVSQPLLGADFLRAHSLLVDVKHHRLVNTHLFANAPVEMAAEPDNLSSSSTFIIILIIHQHLFLERKCFCEDTHSISDDNFPPVLGRCAQSWNTALH